MGGELEMPPRLLSGGKKACCSCTRADPNDINTGDVPPARGIPRTWGLNPISRSGDLQRNQRPRALKCQSRRTESGQRSQIGE
jgi:hypothetical protein